MKSEKTKNIFALLLTLILSCVLMHGGFAVEHESSYASNINSFTDSVRMKRDNETVKLRFINTINIMVEIRDEQERHKSIGMLLSIIEKPEYASCIEYIFPYLPMLMDKSLSGEENALRVFSFLIKYGDQRFIKKEKTYRHQECIAIFSSLYRAPIFSVIEDMHDAWVHDNIIDKKLYERFSDVVRECLRQNKSITIPDIHKVFLCELFYQIRRTDAKNAIVACLVMGEDYRRANVLLRLLPDRSIQKSLYTLIPEVFRGKCANIYGSDADESK